MKRSFNSRILAFSLIEVALSLAIASFGLITILALLPQSFRMMGEMNDTTVTAQIVRLLGNELSALPWHEFPPTGFGPKRYFDAQGIEVDSQHLFVAYVASVCIPEEDDDISLPQEGGRGVLGRPSLRRASIFVARTPNKGFSFDNNRDSHLVKATPLILAKLIE